MKKSLLVTADFPPTYGGVSHSLWNFAKSFSSDEIVVLAPPATVDIASPVTIERRPFLYQLIWPHWLRLAWHVWRLVKKYPIEIIQVGQILPVGTVALLLKRILGIKYVVYVYGQDLVISSRSARKRRLIRAILLNADGIIANSHYTKKLAQEYRAKVGKTVVAYPSVPSHRYTEVYAQDLESFKQIHKLNRAFVLLSVGNLVARKGIDYTLRALARIRNQVPTLRYCIVGTGPLEQTLRTMAHALGLTDIVQFAGRVSDEELALYYTAADVCIMPSRELHDANGHVVDVEGYGMVYREAGLYRKPVIAGRSGGVPEVVQHNKTGILVNPSSISEIGEAILTLYRDPRLRNELGRAGEIAARQDHPVAEQSAAIHSLIATL